MLGAWRHPWVSARGSNRDVDSFHSWQVLATQPWVFMWQKREAGIHYTNRISEKRNSNTWNNDYCFLDIWKVAQSPKTHTSRGACTIMLLLTKITTPHLLTPWNCIIFFNVLKLKFFNFQTERDVSVRQRAVDLLYAMCDKNNAEEIVSEMLTYLETADYSIKEEMVINGHHGNIIVSVGW